MPRQTRIGEALVLSQCLLWALFPIITKLSFNQLTALQSLALSNMASAIFFAGVMTARGKWHELKKRDTWPDLLLVSLIFGVVFYLLFFFGLRFTTAGNAALVGLTEILFTFLFLSVFWKHEKTTKRRTMGAACMAIGAAVILLPKASGLHFGDLLILLAAVIAPFGNRIAKRARTMVSTETIYLARGVVGSVVTLVIAQYVDGLPTAQQFSAAFPYIVINGFVMLGIAKILWFEGMNRLPITKAIALTSFTPAVTLVAAALLLNEPINAQHIFSLLPLVVGMRLLTSEKARDFTQPTAP